MVVPKEDRNKGIGSKAMDLIKSHADEHGLKLDLTPSTHFGGTKSKLIKFYKRHGFKRNKSDFTSSEDMIREPS
jgi:GNAT superfamily N-acetyltransferase